MGGRQPKRVVRSLEPRLPATAAPLPPAMPPCPHPRPPRLRACCRYNLPVTIVVFNNDGVYGGDRRPPHLRALASAGLAAGGHPPGDPPPTSFVPGAQYHLLMQAFGGQGVAVSTAAELGAALREALTSGRPTLLNVAIDPGAGVESGNVHAFNAPKPGAAAAAPPAASG